MRQDSLTQPLLADNVEEGSANSFQQVSVTPDSSASSSNVNRVNRFRPLASDESEGSNVNGAVISLAVPAFVVGLFGGIWRVNNQEYSNSADIAKTSAFFGLAVVSMIAIFVAVLKIKPLYGAASESQQKEQTNANNSVASSSNAALISQSGSPLHHGERFGIPSPASEVDVAQDTSRIGDSISTVQP